MNRTPKHSAGWTCRTRWADYSYDLLNEDSQPTGRRRNTEDVTL
jgi:hypothetical protein